MTIHYNNGLYIQSYNSKVINSIITPCIPAGGMSRTGGATGGAFDEKKSNAYPGSDDVTGIGVVCCESCDGGGEYWGSGWDVMKGAGFNCREGAGGERENKAQNQLLLFACVKGGYKKVCVFVCVCVSE